MKHLNFRALAAAVLALCLTGAAFGQAANEGCWPATRTNFVQGFTTMGRGLKAAPHGLIDRDNLKWELPIAAASGALIAWGDVPWANRARSLTIASHTGTASNVVTGAAIGVTALTYAFGCAKHRSAARDVAFAALAGMGYGWANDMVLKAAFNRQYPYTKNGQGEFWEGGKSFPSGHSAAVWGLAAALAARHPRSRTLKWAAYGMATSVSLLRFPARKHFPSDILVGATVGYASGHYLGAHIGP